MARPYSDDLRRKFLEAYRRGEQGLEKLSESFGVSLGWAKKISASFRRTGAMERPVGRKRGPKSKVTPAVEEYLRGAVRLQGDLTLAELTERVFQDKGVPMSIAWMSTTLIRMDLRLKKNPSCQ